MADNIMATTESPQEWKPQAREWLVMITLALISLMVALDATILIPIIPTLAQDLNGKFASAFWTGTAYLLTSAVFQPFIAAISDVLGRRPLLFLSLVLFTVGSIICATAHDFTFLLLGRSIQGIGGGGIITLVQIVFVDIVPLRQRPKWFSLVLAAWALGTVIGPLLGGIFVQKASFRWAFWINLPFCGIGIVLVLCVVKETTVNTSLIRKLCCIDWIGGCLFIFSMTSFLIGLSWAGVQFAWTSYHTLVPVILGLIGILTTFLWELFGASEPFLQRTLFHKWSLIAAYLCAFIQGLMLFCIMYYVPFYFASVLLKSPMASGVDLFPLSCFLLPGSVIVSQVITYCGRFRWAIWCGWILTTIGAGLLILLDEGMKIGVWIAISLVFGVGNGMLLSAVNFGIQTLVYTEDAGRAASMYTFMRSLGMAIGVAVGGTVFQNVMIFKIRELGLSESIAQEAEGYIAVLKTLPKSNPNRIKAIHAYVYGFHGVFVVVTGISLLGLLAGCFVRRDSLGGALNHSTELRALQRPGADVCEVGRGFEAGQRRRRCSSA